MDRLSKAQRHKNMSAIRSKDTKIEVMLRKALWHRGIRYRKDYRILGYQVDIAITKYKVAVFCDGSFWHGKDGDGSQVATNTKFWQNKIRRNKERDLEPTIVLRDAWWKVSRFREGKILCLQMLKNIFISSIQTIGTQRIQVCLIIHRNY